MEVYETFEAWGHDNITAKNQKTFEITKEKHLTMKGDCILAVNASKGACDLTDEFKRLIRCKDAKLTVILEAGAIREIVIGKGDARLTLNHATDLVVRKSNYVCDRTLMILANKAAADFSRDFIIKLQKPTQKVNVTLVLEV